MSNEDPIAMMNACRLFANGQAVKWEPKRLADWAGNHVGVVTDYETARKNFPALGETGPAYRIEVGPMKRDVWVGAEELVAL